MPDDRNMRERIAAVLDGADILVGWEYRAADAILDEMYEPTKAMLEAASIQAQKPAGWHSVYRNIW